MRMWKPKIISRITWQPISLFNFKGWVAVWQRIGHVLLPNTCYACKRDLPYQSNSPLCQSCVNQVKPVGSLYCIRCGKPLPDGGAHCYQCRGSKASSFACKIIRSAVIFGPQMRPVIHAFKYADQTYLAAYLAGWMQQAWSHYPDLAQAELLIPVPLYPKKHRQRGYNQAELLARELARLQNLPLNISCLVRVRNTPSQTQFGREGRLKNMSGAFTCTDRAAVKGKTVLLIDDVATTGATLEGCAQALKAAGAKRVIAYTLAREV